MRGSQKVICQKCSERFSLILTWKFLMMREHKPPLILPWKMQEDIKSQVLVSLTDKNESTEPKSSQWQLWEVTKPLVKKNGFSPKFEAYLNLKFAWYHLMMLFAAPGWKKLELFLQNPIEITCLNISLNLDSCFGL